MTEDLRHQLMQRWHERDDDGDDGVCARFVPVGACGYTIDVLMSWVADMIVDAQHLGGLVFAQAQTPPDTAPHNLLSGFDARVHLPGPGLGIVPLCGADGSSAAPTTAPATCTACKSMGADATSTITVSTPDPFPARHTAFWEYCAAYVSLRAVDPESSEAEELRDNMDDLWRCMGDDGIKLWNAQVSALTLATQARPKPPALSDWAKVCQALGLPASDTTAEKIVESIGRLQRGNLELEIDKRSWNDICAAVGLIEDQTAGQIIERVQALKSGMDQLCSVVGLVKGRSADDIEASVLALYREISEAQHTLAPYCAEADPGRVDLDGVVSMLVHEVLEPLRVQRERVPRKEQDQAARVAHDLRATLGSAAWQTGFAAKAEIVISLADAIRLLDQQTEREVSAPHASQGPLIAALQARASAAERAQERLATRALTAEQRLDRTLELLMKALDE